jgi:hypothetical protein
MTANVISSHGRVGKTQTLSLSAASATSVPFGSETFRVRIAASSAALVSIGDAVNFYLPANVVEVLLVSPGMTLTATQFNAAGSLTVTELA